MLNIDFEDYSLVLVKDNKIIFSSAKSGLRPLVECITKYKGKTSNCTLYDKITGLAAARLIVYCGFVSDIISRTASKSADELLKKSKIHLKSQNIVENILNNDKTGICPGELKAQKIASNEQFFSHMQGLFKV